tara:strand:+ start:1384 stop:1563 length:180 start_codon:yes stop_codon:yes gene_type:complete
VKTTGEKMSELVDEMEYQLLWYHWIIRCSDAKERVKFDKMNKKQRLKFLKTEERKRGNK